jgi:hypothetical protein
VRALAAGEWLKEWCIEKQKRKFERSEVENVGYENSSQTACHRVGSCEPCRSNFVLMDTKISMGVVKTMKNPLTSIFSKIHRILFEESDDPMAPDRYRTKGGQIIHNQNVIQSLAVLVGLGSLSVVPLVVILITIPYFALAYVVWALCTGIAWLALARYVKRLNARSMEET